MRSPRARKKHLTNQHFLSQASALNPQFQTPDSSLLKPPLAVEVAESVATRLLVQSLVCKLDCYNCLAHYYESKTFQRNDIRTLLWSQFIIFSH